MTDTDTDIAARIKADCVRAQGRECRTRRCFIEAGWDGATTPIPVEAACIEWQSATTITRLRAQVETLEGAAQAGFDLLCVLSYKPGDGEKPLLKDGVWDQKMNLIRTALATAREKADG